MSSDDLTPAACRAFATQARQRASVATSESDRVAWIKIAREWDEIATAMEELPKPQPPSGLPPLH